jgi:hypothetical protein
MLASTTDNQLQTPFNIAGLLKYLQLADFLAEFGVNINNEYYEREVFGRLFSIILLGRYLGQNTEQTLKIRRTRYILKFNPEFQTSLTNRLTAFHSL